MTTYFIGVIFPDSWLWSKYEKYCIDSVTDQVKTKFSNSKNLIINLTWFGPQFNNNSYREFLELTNNHVKFDNLFLLATVDPVMITQQQIADMVDLLGGPRLFKIGNFDTEYHFNFFAPILSDHFSDLQEEQLILTDPQYLFINYNRKPRKHRVDFVRKLIDTNLKDLGIVTLGKPNLIYDKDPNNKLYFSIGETPDTYSKNNHWFTGPDEFEIPHDVLTLHRLDYWQQHFLNIIGATEFNPWDDIFVSETQFKPILGLRPFVINGNVRTYQWLRDNGFRTFNHYFDQIELENITELQVHDSIVQVLRFLAQLDKTQILEMYNHMLPDLQHNKQRFFEFAQEQRYRIKNLFPC